MFEFEITPAVLRLDYNVDLKVKDETNITYDSNPGSSDFRSKTLIAYIYYQMFQFRLN